MSIWTQLQLFAVKLKILKTDPTALSILIQWTIEHSPKITVIAEKSVFLICYFIYCCLFVWSNDLFLRSKYLLFFIYLFWLFFFVMFISSIRVCLSFSKSQFILDVFLVADFFSSFSLANIRDPLFIAIFPSICSMMSTFTFTLM